mgnify:FL=1
MLFVCYSLISISSETKFDKLELLKNTREYILKNRTEIKNPWNLKIDSIMKKYDGYCVKFFTYYKDFVAHNSYFSIYIDFKGNIEKMTDLTSKNKFVEINIKYTRKEARDKLEKFLNDFYIKYYKTKFKYPIPKLDDLIKHCFNKFPFDPGEKTWVADLKNPVVQKTGPGYGYGFYKDFYRSYYPSNELFLENTNWKDVVENSFNNYPRLCWLIPLDYERRYAYVDCETCEIIDVDTKTEMELLTPIH